jgi:hypothetical protein
MRKRRTKAEIQEALNENYTMCSLCFKPLKFKVENIHAYHSECAKAAELDHGPIWGVLNNASTNKRNR